MHATDLAVIILVARTGSDLPRPCLSQMTYKASYFSLSGEMRTAAIKLYARRESMSISVSKSYLVSFESAIRPKSA